MSNRQEQSVDKNSAIPFGIRQKSQSRLSAVQICYGYEISPDSDIDAAMISYMQHYDEDMQLNIKFLKRLIRGVHEQQADIDDIIAEYLDKKWAVGRLDNVMRALLRVAVFELREFPNTALRTIINEYIIVAKGFFDDQDVGFVNGILDNIGHKIRA